MKLFSHSLAGHTRRRGISLALLHGRDDPGKMPRRRAA